MKKYFTNLFLGTVHENLRSSFLYLQPVNSKNVGFYDEAASPIKGVTLSSEKDNGLTWCVLVTNSGK